MYDCITLHETRSYNLHIVRQSSDVARYSIIAESATLHKHTHSVILSKVPMVYKPWSVLFYTTPRHAFSYTYIYIYIHTRIWTYQIIMSPAEQSIFYTMTQHKTLQSTRSCYFSLWHLVYTRYRHYVSHTAYQNIVQHCMGIYRHRIWHNNWHLHVCARVSTYIYAYICVDQTHYKVTKHYCPTHRLPSDMLLSVLYDLCEYQTV